MSKDSEITHQRQNAIRHCLNYTTALCATVAALAGTFIFVQHEKITQLERNLKGEAVVIEETRRDLMEEIGERKKLYREVMDQFLMVKSLQRTLGEETNKIADVITVVKDEVVRNTQNYSFVLQKLFLVMTNLTWQEKRIEAPAMPPTLDDNAAGLREPTLQ